MAWALASVLAVVALAFGAYKSNTALDNEPSMTAIMSEAVDQMSIANAAEQFEESDVLAHVIHNRDSLPTQHDLARRLAAFPLMIVPSGFGLPKPIPYDYDVRESALAGEAQTGLPAGLPGELWLMGGFLTVVAGGLAIGAGMNFYGRVSGTTIQTAWAALIFGHLFLLISRPLVISLSRLLLYWIALRIAHYLSRRTTVLSYEKP